MFVTRYFENVCLQIINLMALFTSTPGSDSTVSNQDEGSDNNNGKFVILAIILIILVALIIAVFIVCKFSVTKQLLENKSDREIHFYCFLLQYEGEGGKCSH